MPRYLIKVSGSDNTFTVDKESYDRAFEMAGDQYGKYLPTKIDVISGFDGIEHIETHIIPGNVAYFAIVT